VPTTAFRVAADPQLTVLHYDGRRYIRFATAGNGDPVAVELPSGRVVELVTRHNPPAALICLAGRAADQYVPSRRSSARTWGA